MRRVLRPFGLEGSQLVVLELAVVEGQRAAAASRRGPSRADAPSAMRQCTIVCCGIVALDGVEAAFRCSSTSASR
jgi:hypothetical protein